MMKMKRAFAVAIAAALAFSVAGADGGVVYAKKASVQKTKAQSVKKVKTGKTKTFKIKKNMVITDKNIDKLPKVLASKKVQSITLKLTSTGELTIDGKDFSTKKLTIDAPNTNIINNATFDGIKLNAVGVFNEKGNANNIEINTDKDIHVVVETDRRVSSITYGKEASGTNSVDVKNGVLASVFVNSAASFAFSASGDASVGTISVDGAGAYVSVNAIGTSRINNLNITKEAASGHTYVSATAADKSVIKNINTSADDSVLHVTANDSSQINNIKAIGKINLTVSGTTLRRINVDVTGMEKGSSVVVNNSHVKVEKDNDQVLSDMVKNTTGLPLYVVEKRDPNDVSSGGFADTGFGWSGGSGSSYSGGNSSKKSGLRSWKSGKTAYVDSAKAYIIEENLEELTTLPDGTSNLKGKDLVVTMKVKDAKLSKTGVNVQTNLAVMSDGWINWYGEDWQGITLQDEEKEYTLKLSFDKYHGDTTKANPKYYRLRFEGEGLSLSYMIMSARIVDHVDEVLPTIGGGDEENEGQLVIPETVAVFKSYGDFIGWEQDNPNIPNVIGTLPATADGAMNKAVELKLEVEKIEGCQGLRGIIWGMAGDVDDWSQGDSWWQDEAGSVDITQPGIYTIRFNLGEYFKAKNKLVTSHIRLRLSTDDEQEIGAKITMKVHNATIVDVVPENTEGAETEGTQTEGTETEGTQTEGTETEGTETGSDSETETIEYGAEETLVVSDSNNFAEPEGELQLNNIPSTAADISGKEVQVNVKINSISLNGEATDDKAGVFIWAMSEGDNWSWIDPWIQGETVNLGAGEEATLRYSLTDYYNSEQNPGHLFAKHFKLRFTSNKTLTIKYQIDTPVIKTIESEQEETEDEQITIKNWSLTEVGVDNPQNLIASLGDWIYVNNNASASVSRVNNTSGGQDIIVTIGENGRGDAPGDVQLSKQMNLVAGKTYKYSFDISCNRERLINAFVQSTNGGWSIIEGTWKETVSGNSIHIEKQFTISDDYNTDVPEGQTGNTQFAIALGNVLLDN